MLRKGDIMTRNKLMGSVCLVLAAGLFVGAGTAMAAARTSSGTGPWENTSTWGGNPVPTGADDVTISVSHVVTINGLAINHIKSLTVNGTLDHADNNDTEANKIILDITNDCTIALGGSIALEGLGYEYNQGPGKPLSGNFNGGSHGGRGGVIAAQSPDVAGPVYGSLVAPTNLGSGASYDTDAEGGGAVQLIVGGTTTIDGTIDADGQAGTPYCGGAGGSVFITTANFGGSGTISANGGFQVSANRHTGGGGGGRIAVVLTSGNTFGSVTMTAYGGPNGNSAYAGAGTVYTKTPSQTYGTLKIDNDGYDLIDVVYSTTRTLCQGTRIPDGETWQVDRLEIVNGGNLWVRTNTTLSIDGADLSGSTTAGYLIIDSGGTLAGGSDLTISNITFMPLAGSKFTGTTDLTIDPSAVVTHIENSDSEDWTLEIDIPGDLTIPTGISINLDGLGYGYRRGPGRPRYANGTTYNYGHGGSYGGRGGKSSYAEDSGPTYGSITAPVNIGSGGGWNYASGTNNGGGAIKLTVGGTTALGGELSADGVGFNGSAQGGGSGGSVWLTTSILSGSGTITADGGLGTHAGGGGGRISVVLTGSDSFGSVAMHAFGGTGPSAPTAGAAGTIYKQTQTQGDGMGDLLIDNNSQDSNRDTEINTNVTDTVVGSVTWLNGADLGLREDATFTVQGGIWSNGNEFASETGSEVRFTTTNTVAIYGSQTFYTLSITNAGKTVQFAAGDTTTVEEVLTLTGDASEDLVLRPTPAGSPWYLSVHGDAEQNVEYVDVAWSHADVGYATTISPQNSTNSLNNENWSFVVAGATNTWIGGSGTGWTTGANWDQGNAPQSTDAAIIISNGCASYPELTSDVTVETDLIMRPTSSISLAGNNFTVTGDADIDGSLVASGTETVNFQGDVDFTGGSFTKATSLVYVGGTSTQSVTSAGESFYRLTVTNDSALVTFTDAAQATYYRSESADVTYSNNFTATEFHVYSEGGAVTQTFNNGSTYAIVDLFFSGTLGKTQHLESTSGGAWTLNVSRMAYVRYVSAEYSDASGGIEIIAFNSKNSGNNNNWAFGGPFAVWTGNTDSDFHTGSNWDPTGVPDATTYILVDDTTTLTVSSPATVEYALIGGENATLMEINSAFTVVSNVDVGVNGTLEVNDDPGMTISNDLLVSYGGVVNHNQNSTAENDTMMLTVEGDLTIALGGAIDVDGLGYRHNEGPGTWYAYGHGGSYGGRGGYTASYPLGDSGDTYGSIRAPVNIGSGGSWYNVYPGTNNGGGAVKVTVGGTTTLNGDLSADGIGLPAGNGASAMGGGSGGSVWLTTSSLTGSGTITANGGPATWSNGAGGGGGRISVVLTGSDSFGPVTIHAFGGTSVDAQEEGAAGTIYKQTQTQGAGMGDVLIDNNGQPSVRSTYAPAQTDAVVDELVQAMIIVTNDNTELTLSTNLWVADILVYTNADLVLGVYTMYVDSTEHHIDNVSQSGMGGPTNGVDNYNQIIWQGAPAGAMFIIR